MRHSPSTQRAVARRLSIGLTLLALLALLMSVTSASCGGASTIEVLTPDASEGLAREAPSCEPERCGRFCDHARCLFPNRDKIACLARCRDRCGDEFFDDSDAAVLRCVAELSSDPTCAQSRACCDHDFTNQVCPTTD